LYEIRRSIQEDRSIRGFLCWSSSGEEEKEVEDFSHMQIKGRG
jgi:hypothetical protein